MWPRAINRSNPWSQSADIPPPPCTPHVAIDTPCSPAYTHANTPSASGVARHWRGHDDDAPHPRAPRHGRGNRVEPVLRRQASDGRARLAQARC
jgi:hypothetical protein